ncbi:hypothetical protein HK102_005036, partial [Quaeritorhiza haematococci]
MVNVSTTASFSTMAVDTASKIQRQPHVERESASAPTAYLLTSPISISSLNIPPSPPMDLFHSTSLPFQKEQFHPPKPMPARGHIRQHSQPQLLATDPNISGLSPWSAHSRSLSDPLPSTCYDLPLLFANINTSVSMPNLATPAMPLCEDSMFNTSSAGIDLVSLYSDASTTLSTASATVGITHVPTVIDLPNFMDSTVLLQGFDSVMTEHHAQQPGSPLQLPVTITAAGAGDATPVLAGAHLSPPITPQNTPIVARKPSIADLPPSIVDMWGLPSIPGPTESQLLGTNPNGPSAGLEMGFTMPDLSATLPAANVAVTTSSVTPPAANLAITTSSATPPSSPKSLGFPSGTAPTMM